MPPANAPATAFATQFARLLSQRIREPDNVDAHNITLGELSAANGQPVVLRWADWNLRVGSDVLGPTTPEMLELLSRMAAHGIRELSFDARADRAHLLSVIWILSGDAAIGDGGAGAMSQFGLLGATSVRAVAVAATATAGAEQRAASAPSPVVTNVDRPPPKYRPPEPPKEETVESLIARFVAASSTDEIVRALEAMATYTELRPKRLDDIVTILLALIASELQLTDPQARRSFGAVMKRIARASILRALAAALSTSPDRRADYMRIIAYFGEPAADQLVEQLATAQSSRERRILFDALIELRRGVPLLINLLGDGRWYVVRNAAELLGELRAVEAEQRLAWLFGHADARVRRAAVVALAKLQTPGAREALRQALMDDSPDVRLAATHGLAADKDRSSVSQVLRALAEEKDPDMQRTLFLALGKIGTPEAIEHLVRAAEPEKGFFKRKPTPLRVAAVVALAECDAPGALAVVRRFVNDREAEVRAAATKALTPARPSTPAQRKDGW